MKTQMQLANRAWRTETKSNSWHLGWRGGQRGWKELCRKLAEIMVIDGGKHFNSQEAANDAVREELSNSGD